MKLGRRDSLEVSLSAVALSCAVEEAVAHELGATRDFQNLTDENLITLQAVKLLELSNGHPKLLSEKNEGVTSFHFVEDGVAFRLTWRLRGDRRRLSELGQFKAPILFLRGSDTPLPLHRVLQTWLNATQWRPLGSCLCEHVKTADAREEED